MIMGVPKFMATNKGKYVFNENTRTLDFIGNPSFPNSYGLVLTQRICTANRADVPLVG